MGILHSNKYNSYMLRWLEAFMMTECSSIFEPGNKCSLFQRLSLIMSDVTDDGGRDCIQNVSSFHIDLAGCLWGRPCIFVSCCCCCCCYWCADGFLCHLDWAFHIEQAFMCSNCLIPSVVARCYSICYMHLMYVCVPRWIQYFFLRKKSMYYSELLLKYILYVHSLHFH